LGQRRKGQGVALGNRQRDCRRAKLLAKQYRLPRNAGAETLAPIAAIRVIRMRFADNLKGRAFSHAIFAGN
jgi:hypothetical protein